MTTTSGRRGRSWKKILLWVIGIGVVVLVLIQFVPYGRTSQTNPPATNPFKWTDPQAEALARTACYDCHSNETTWWWATKIAPMSWLVQHDVDEARDSFNFSEWAGYPSVAEFSEAVNGEMPPLQYTLIHPSAKLSDAEKQTLIDGFANSLPANGAAATGGEASAAAATPSSASVATAEATAIIQSRCGSCHDASPALAFRTSDPTQAQALIDDMIRRGAQVSSSEQRAMVAYFTR